jgi:hypothetical protein
MRYPVLRAADRGSFQHFKLNGERMAIPLIEKTAKNFVFTVQDYSLFAYQAATNLFRPPVYWPEFLVQSDIIGVG